MRIEAMNQIAQMYKANQTQSVGKTQRAKAKDEVHISEIGKDFQIAKRALQDIPDVRQEKIAAIKSSMEAGTYEVDSDSLAEKLLEKYKDVLGY